MCGITGYLGKDVFVEYVINGLKALQNRGYDSAGISTIVAGQITTIKYASTQVSNSLKILENEVINHNFQTNIGIGHTRWATHGNCIDANSHPHHDSLNRISLVHNGIIENYSELKSELKDYTFKSTTDTEIIAILIGIYLDEGEHISCAIQLTLEKLRGTWALIVIHQDYPNTMWATRNGSPLLIGMSENCAIIASEQIAFEKSIQKYMVLDNTDVVEITYDGNIRCSIHLETRDVYNVQSLENNYNYWLLKEIEEQPQSALMAINNGGRIASESCVKLGGLDITRELLLTINHLIILGCGTSYNAGLWSTSIFKDLDIFDTVTIFDGAEFNENDIPRGGITGIIMVSQSGETKDLYRCFDAKCITIGVVNVVDSLIARETNCGVYLNAGREVAVASTKSFTSQCIALAMIAVWFSQNRNNSLEKRKQIIKDLKILPLQLQTMVTTYQTEYNDSYIDRLDTTNIFILGKGKNEAIAKEGALKLKEVAYIFAEGYSSASLKHGSFALIQPDLPIILLDIDDDTRAKTQNIYQELMARDAHVIRITDKGEGVKIERNRTFGGLLANCHIQYLGYYLAIKRGINPDFPRNLAKVVTVE